MTNDKPPVAPVEGHYAMLRSGEVHGPLACHKDLNSVTPPWYASEHFIGLVWDAEGRGALEWDHPSRGVITQHPQEKYNIIATISPDVMALVTEKSTYGAILFGLRDRLARLEALVPLADAVLDHADQHCRWFDISTAPDEGKFSVVFDTNGVDDPVIEHDCCKYGGRIVKFSGYPSTMRVFNPQPVMWHPPLPPPSNPPLPAVFVELGLALERLKSQP
jgi:hypothetical protein